jgi:23S rRNA G2445 N2-methylase RlmL
MTNGFEDFSLICNVPYGKQSQEKQGLGEDQIQNLYRRFGTFLRSYPHLDLNSFVVAQKHKYQNPLSFEKYSNCGWDKVLDF